MGACHLDVFESSLSKTCQRLEPFEDMFVIWHEDHAYNLGYAQ